MTLPRRDALALDSAARGAARLFDAEEYFLLRAPLLPVSAWRDVDGTTPSREEAISRLCNLWQDARLREAVYIASPSLHARLTDWDWRCEDDKGRKLLHAFYRYVARACTRPTPFGAFAACATGQVGNGTFALDGSLRRHTRLDTSAIAAIGAALTRDKAIRHTQRYRRNDCVWRVDGRWHYVDWTQHNGRRRYLLASATDGEELSLALEMSRGDGADFSALVRTLCERDAELDSESAAEFVDALIDAHLLVSVLEPLLTGREALAHLIEVAGDKVPALQNARVALDALDAQPLGVDALPYTAIADALRPLNAEFAPDHLFHVDLFRDAPQLGLPQTVIDGIARAVESVFALTARRNNNLDDFCRRYTHRYEERRMPLLAVLDEDTGIGAGRWTGVPSDLLDGIVFGNIENAVASTWENLLLRKLAAASAGTREIVLDETELPGVDETLRAALPASVGVMASVVGAANFADGDWQVFVHSIWGPSGTNLCGRFGFGDARLTAHMRDTLLREERNDPDAIHAEIVHLPQERLGNVVCRPLLREFELGVLGQSGAPAAQRIELDDLDIEVEGLRITLWSRRLQRRVVPRLSNAHNHGADTLGIYRFLCQLSLHGATQAGFAWNASFAALSRLPRLRVGRLILAPAQWRVEAKQCADLVGCDATARMAAVANLRATQEMPRYVGIVESDNVLAIDLDNPIAVDNLAEQLARQKRLTLVELFLDEAQLCLAGKDGGYTHEIVLPLRRITTPPKIVDAATRFSAAKPKNPTPPACFLPGSEWLYYRLYGGASTLDRLLLDELAPLAEVARRDGDCERWFFVRYGDPDWHLRLRFNGDPMRLATLMVRLGENLQRLLRAGTLARVELSGYEPEYDRYGGRDGMAACEDWFAADSRAVCSLLAQARDNGERALRWQFAALSLQRGFDDLGLTLEHRHALVAHQAERFAKEVGLEGACLTVLGKKYRATAARLNAICADALPDAAPFAAASATLDALAPARRIAAGALNAAQLTVPLDSVLPSLVHMSCNRWFPDNSRRHEAVLLELLRRGYASALARRKST